MTISGMNIFVAFFVLLLLLAESTPPASSSLPLIGKTSFTISLFLKRFIATTNRTKGHVHNYVCCKENIKFTLKETLQRVLCLYKACVIVFYIYIVYIFIN